MMWHCIIARAFVLSINGENPFYNIEMMRLQCNATRKSAFSLVPQTDHGQAVLNTRGAAKQKKVKCEKKTNNIIHRK